jgi:carbonic anhydrase
VPVSPLQWHLHTPSEHTLQGKLSAVEAHLVTKIDASDVPACGSTGCTAVFGVLYDLSEDITEPDAFLTPFLSNIPEQVGPKVINLHSRSLASIEVVHGLQLLTFACSPH